MKKQSVRYEISFRGTSKECEEFEKTLDSLRFTYEDIQEWDDVNNPNSAPSGVIYWSKLKSLKHCELIIHRKVSK